MGLQRLFLPQLGETRAAFLTVFKYSITRLVVLLDREYSADSQQAHAKIPRDERAAPNRPRTVDATRRRPPDRPAAAAGGHGCIGPEAGEAVGEIRRRAAVIHAAPPQAVRGPAAAGIRPRAADRGARRRH